MFLLDAFLLGGQKTQWGTLYELGISLQLYLSLNGPEIRFLQDKEFVVMKNTLDTRMK